MGLALEMPGEGGLGLQGDAAHYAFMLLAGLCTGAYTSADLLNPFRVILRPGELLLTLPRHVCLQILCSLLVLSALRGNGHLLLHMKSARGIIGHELLL